MWIGPQFLTWHDFADWRVWVAPVALAIVFGIVAWHDIRVARRRRL